MTRKTDEPSLRAFLDEVGRLDGGSAADHVRTYLHGQARLRLPAADGLRAVMDSEDLTQDAFMDLIESLPAFRGSSWEEFLAFAAAVLRRRLQMAARHHGARKRRSPETAEPTAAKAASSSTPSRHVAAKEDGRRLARLISSLDEDLRTPLDMRLAGASYEAIAERLHLTPVTARKRVSRAIEALRGMW